MEISKLDRYYLDWHYYFKEDTKGQLFKLKGTVKKILLIENVPNQNTDVVIFTIYERPDEFWFFEDANTVSYRECITQLKETQKILLVLWKKKSSFRWMNEYFVKRITIVNQSVPVGFELIIKYSDSKTFSITSDNALTTRDAINFIIQHTKNEKLKDSLHEQINCMCISCGNESSLSCSYCGKSVCGLCNHNCISKLSTRLSKLDII